MRAAVSTVCNNLASSPLNRLNTPSFLKECLKERKHTVKVSLIFIQQKKEQHDMQCEVWSSINESPRKDRITNVCVHPPYSSEQLTFQHLYTGQYVKLFIGPLILTQLE